MDGGASGYEDFTLLLRLRLTHFDQVNTREGYTKLHTFGACTRNGTPLSDFSRELRVLVLVVTGSERVLSPEMDVVLEVVRMAFNEQFPTLMPTLYPGSKAPDPRPYASLDAMSRALSHLALNKTPAVNDKTHFLYLFLRRERRHPPSGPRPGVDGRGQGRVPSQSPSRQTGSSHNPIAMSITDTRQNV